MIKLCVWSGCNLLYENNKPGLRNHFEERGYLPCLIHLPGRNEPGIPASTQTKQDLIDTTKNYIHESIHKVNFIRLLEDWRDFDPENTKRFDAGMAGSWTLIADKSFSFNTRSAHLDNVKRIDMKKIFR
mgnify:CR=1 FL=1